LDLFFNELSLEGKESIKIKSALMLVKVYRALLKYNITTCRIDSADNVKLFQMIQNMPDSFNIRNFYFSFFRTPYESEIVEKEQDEYYAHNWSYEGKMCIGLALASMMNSAALSILETEWDMPFIHLMKDDNAGAVRNICTEEHVDVHIPKIQQEGKTELIESDMPFENKKISLRDDHGKDILLDFSKRLVRCTYIIEIVNSLPFNPHERRFIKKVYGNGLIEIVLPWTDKGYGVVVKTTGRNINETEKIGEIIEEKYGGI
jgi:hypothetical protein